METSMENFILDISTKVIFGREAELSMIDYIQENSYRKVLIHFGGKSVIKSGLLDRIRQAFVDKKVDYIELGGVEPNPKISLVRKGILLAKEEKVDFILAIGGGSVIDSAKGIGIGLANQKDPWEMIENQEMPKHKFPVGVIPTIAAAGSETSYSHVITNEDLQLKRALNHDLIRPEIACMNPELTFTVSPYQTACGIVDIMMHTLERYFTLDQGVEITDRIAEGLLLSVIEAGKKVMIDPMDYNARATLMWASSLSHNGLTGCGKKTFFPVHKIEHDFSGYKDTISHGAGLAVLFPAWARYVHKSHVTKFAQLASRVFQVETNFDNLEETGLTGIERMVEFFESIGMPTSLEEFDLTLEDVECIADLTTNSGKSVVNSYFPLQREDLLNIYKLAGL